MLLILTITSYFYGLKGEIPPLSWEEIHNDLFFMIISSMVFAIFMSIWYYYNIVEQKNEES
jgi:hypothetical protein